MKSRVQKNHELYETLASSTEEKVESNDLSRYANQLNEIDNKFERMNIMSNMTHDPIHAKEAVSEEESLSNVYDTFENEYLKEFLEEVKEYNVKKGYRTTEDTQANILHAFVGKTPVEKPIARDTDDVDAIESLVSSIERNQDIVTEINNTKEFTPESHTPSQRPSAVEPLESDFPIHDVVHDIESLFEEEEPQMIHEHHDDSDLLDSKELLLKQGVNPEENWRSGLIPSQQVQQPELDKQDAQVEKPSVDVKADDLQQEDQSFESAEHEVVTDEPQHTDAYKAFDSSEIDVLELNRVALEETKTIQLKLEEQQKDLQTISKSMVHTNRILNSVIAIVLMCFFLVVAFIVKMFWFS